MGKGREVKKMWIIIIEGRPYWSIAAFTVRRHCSRSCARLHATFRQMLSALKSFSTVRVQVHLGRSGGRLQWLGRPDMTVRSALVWSKFPSDLSICPNNRRRLPRRTVEICVNLDHPPRLLLSYKLHCVNRTKVFTKRSKL